MAYDMIITNGTVVCEGTAVHADLAIEDGVVQALGRNLSRGGARTIDASDCFVMPGVVDPHVHVGVPGDPNMDPIIEDLPAATRSGVLGGTTTICSYVRGVPDGSLDGAITGEIELGLEDASTDFALNLLCTPDDDPREAVLAGRKHGITTFKGMLAYRTRGLMLSDRHVLELMDEVATAGGTLLVHAENGLATEYLETKERASLPIGREAYLQTSPGCLEAEGAYRAATLASIVGCPLIFVHMSSRESVKLAPAISSAAGAKITWETQPHYLLLTNEALMQRDALAKVGPPLRHKEDTDAIRRSVVTGVISHLSSDHAPRTTEMKLSRDSILDAPYGGTSGTELLLRLAYEQLWHQGHIGIERLADIVSTNAARAYGLFPKKGTIRPGADGDVVIMPRDYSPVPIKADELHGLSDYSLYEGLLSAPPPPYVLRAGQIVATDGVPADRVPAAYLSRE